MKSVVCRSEKLNQKLIAIFGILFFLVLGAIAHADNPQIRACRMTNGQIHVADIFGGVNDQYMFCQYGPAMLDALSVMSALNHVASQAVLAYSQVQTFEANVCNATGGQLVPGRDLEGRQFQFCRFSDGSTIELNTLARSKFDSSNSGLNRALGLNFY